MAGRRFNTAGRCYMIPASARPSELDGYLNHLGLSAGYVVLFDQRPQPGPDRDGPLETRTSASGHTVTIARPTVPPLPDNRTEALPG